MINFKYYAPSQTFNAATDWNLDPSFSVDLSTALSQPIKVAVLPVFYNVDYDFAYDGQLASLDLSKFDLVLLSDIEYRTLSSIQAWAQQQKIKKYLLAIGGTHDHETIDESYTVYRPWWAYNLLRYNQYQDTGSITNPYLFDVLLGARRPHRDFAMLSFQSTGLLDQSIVTYRDFFQGAQFDHHNDQITQKFKGINLKWPYVSENLDTTWEVTDNLTFSISPFVPWKIYQHTWYSIVCETNGVGRSFFMSEKTTKSLFARRLFLMFTTPNFLTNLKKLGFETFDSVIDESYDQILEPIARFEKVKQQMIRLSQENPHHVYQKINPILEHNYHTLINLQTRTQKHMHDLVVNTVQSLR
jgi:hypothetical protein